MHEINDKDGRFNFLVFKIDEELYSIFNLYAPNTMGQPKKTFFSQITTLALDCDSEGTAATWLEIRGDDIHLCPLLRAGV